MKNRCQTFVFPRKTLSSGVFLFLLISGMLACASSSGSSQAQTGSPYIDNCPVFPADNIWNRPITDLPVMRNSSQYIASIGLTGHLQAYFGGISNGVPEGFPFVVVNNSQPRVPVRFYYANDSDPGPYPIPVNVPIENGANSSGDRHVIVIDKDTCRLYEMFSSYHQANGSWKAGSGAVWNLSSDALRPDGWGAADAAGLPIFAGLVRYDEVAAGVINHALRFTVSSSQAAYLWPGRAFASTLTNPNLPPMGLRLRLKASVDISSFSPNIQVILTALKTYGMFVADNGHNWVLSGAADARWNHTELLQLNRIIGADFEAVDESSLQVSPDSGQAVQPAPSSHASVPAPASSSASTSVASSPVPVSDAALPPDTPKMVSYGPGRLIPFFLSAGFGLLLACILLFVLIHHKRQKKRNSFLGSQVP